MKPNNHLMTIQNLRALMAQKTDMSLPAHENAQAGFQQIAERLVQADAMEAELAKPDNVVPIDKNKPKKKK